MSPVGGPTGGAALGAARFVRLGFPWRGGPAWQSRVSGLRLQGAYRTQARHGDGASWFWHELLPGVGWWTRVVRGFERGGPHVSLLTRARERAAQAANWAARCPTPTRCPKLTTPVIFR